MKLPAVRLVISAVLLVCTAKLARAESLFALGADAGLGSVGTTPHAALAAAIDLREGNLALGVAGRIRLALSGEGGSGPLRRRDFDEASDFVHLLRYFDFQRRFGNVAVSFGAGELRGFTLGHGSLLRDYSNIADPDHLHAGARLELKHEVFDLTLMLDNLARPTVLAGRFALRPFSKLRRLSFGANAVLDTHAPLRFAGPPLLREVDDAWNLQAAESAVLGLMALDIEYRFGSSHKGVTPYLDLATSLRGVGLHAGARGRLPLGDSGVALAGQLEYRLSSGGYAPGYVTTFYDIERQQSSLAFSDPRRAEVAEAKLTSLEAKRFGGHGGLAQLGVDAGRRARLRLGYRYHPGPDGSQAWLRLVTEPTTRLTLGALLVVRALGQASQDAEGWAALAEARYRFTPYLYTTANFTRSWALADSTRSYAPLTSFNIGVGGSWSR